LVEVVRILLYLFSILFFVCFNTELFDSDGDGGDCDDDTFCDAAIGG
jgi:hypothetical protein